MLSFIIKLYWHINQVLLRNHRNNSQSWTVGTCLKRSALLSRTNPVTIEVFTSTGFIWRYPNSISANSEQLPQAKNNNVHYCNVVNLRLPFSLFLLLIFLYWAAFSWFHSLFNSFLYCFLNKRKQRDQRSFFPSCTWTKSIYTYLYSSRAWFGFLRTCTRQTKQRMMMETRGRNKVNFEFTDQLAL